MLFNMASKKYMKKQKIKNGLITQPHIGDFTDEAAKAQKPA